MATGPLYYSETYVAASRRLDEACAWIERLGISFSATRLGRYRQLLDALARHQLADDLSGFFESYSFEEFVNAAHEADEYTRIHRGLGSRMDDVLIDRVRSTLKGHELYVLERPDRSGRDFSLELAVAAKFVDAGYDVDFGSAADVRVEYGGYNLFIECKRLKSRGKVELRIKEGQSQLRRRFQTAKSKSLNCGLLVLSIGKLVNPELGFIEGDTPSSLSEQAAAHIKAFIVNYRKHWQPTIDKKILGVVVVFDTPGILVPSRKIVRCHEVAANNAAPLYSIQNALLIDIAEKVFQPM